MNKTGLYETKNSGYFDAIRSDIVGLLPGKVSCLMEVGCGSGDTLKFLKGNRWCDWTCGIELIPSAAAIARSKVDLLIEGDIEDLDPAIEPETLDAILCLDVLEHLTDPWRVLAKLYRYLKPEGLIIASVPNVRNFRVLLPLLFQGKWEYTNTGLLDKAHLRLFTRDSAIRLIESSGFNVELIKETGIDAHKNRLANIATFSLFKHFLAMQYLIKARKSPMKIKPGE